MERTEAKKRSSASVCEQNSLSFLDQIKRHRGHRSRKLSLKKAKALDLLDSGNSEVNHLYKSIIKEFSGIRKPDGLIVGTNEVLRLLENEELAAVFMFKNKSSIQIKTILFRICKASGVSFIWMEKKDKDILGPEFPQSVTYGIKKESLETLKNLKSLLLELSEKRKKKNTSLTDISSGEMKPLPTEENTNLETSDDSIFHHIHEGQISKNSNSQETGFLSLNKFSTSDKEIDFLDYDSVACSGILSIK